MISLLYNKTMGIVMGEDSVHYITITNRASCMASYLQIGRYLSTILRSVFIQIILHLAHNFHSQCYCSLM